MGLKNIVVLTRKLLLLLTILPALGVMHASVAEASDGLLKITSGFDYSSGSYGQDVTTEIEYYPVTVEYFNDAWSAKLTVPYIKVTGNGTVVPGVSGPAMGGVGSVMVGVGPAPAPETTPTPTTVVDSGLGDVEASVAYAFFPELELIPFVELRAKAKLGTADEAKALGTGENDYSVQVDGVFGRGSVQPFYTLGYIFVGDTSTVDYNDRFFGTAGLMFIINDHNNVGMTYDYKQASLDNAEDEGVAGIFLSSKLSSGWAVSISMSTGLTDNSPDYGGSLMVGREF